MRGIFHTKYVHSAWNSFMSCLGLRKFLNCPLSFAPKFAQFMNVIKKECALLGHIHADCGLFRRRSEHCGDSEWPALKGWIVVT